MENLFMIDVNTSQKSRGRFARLRVVMDLNKPLNTYIRTTKRKKKKRCLKLEYEGLNMICFECGHFGHTKEGCSSNVKDHVATD